MPRRNPEWREGPKPTGEPWLAILHKEVRGLEEERDACAAPPGAGQTLGCRKGIWVEEIAKRKGPEAGVCSAGTAVMGDGVGWAERRGSVDLRGLVVSLAFLSFSCGSFLVFIAFVTILLLF